MKNTTRQKDEPLFFQCDSTCRHCMGKDLSKYTVHVQTSREPLDRLLRERVLLVASLPLYISTDQHVNRACSHIFSPLEAAFSLIVSSLTKRILLLYQIWPLRRTVTKSCHRAYRKVSLTPGTSRHWTAMTSIFCPMCSRQIRMQVSGP
jgi:hypothetical protein